MSKVCAALTARGKRCLNQVTNTQSVCHVHSRAQTEKNSKLDKCRIRRTPRGWACLSHDLTSREWQVAIALGADIPCRLRISRKEQLRLSAASEPSTLMLLARSTDREILEQVASNQSSPVGALQHIWQNKGHLHTVRRSLAGNRNCPEDILLEMVKNREATFRIKTAIISNPNVTREVLLLMAGESRLALLGILARQDCPADILMQISQTSDERVADLAAQHRNCPPEVISRLSKHQAVSVRVSVALRSDTLLDDLRSLIADEHPVVRLAAQKGLRNRAPSGRLPGR